CPGGRPPPHRQGGRRPQARDRCRRVLPLRHRPSVPVPGSGPVRVDHCPRRDGRRDGRSVTDNTVNDRPVAGATVAGSVVAGDIVADDLLAPTSVAVEVPDPRLTDKRAADRRATDKHVGDKPVDTKAKDNRAWFLVLPVVVSVAFTAVIPLMTVVNFSVQDVFSPDDRIFVGLEWFRTVSRDPEVRSAFLRTLMFSAQVLLLEIPLGVA